MSEVGHLKPRHNLNTQKKTRTTMTDQNYSSSAKIILAGTRIQTALLTACPRTQTVVSSVP